MHIYLAHRCHLAAILVGFSTVVVAVVAVVHGFHVNSTWLGVKIIEAKDDEEDAADKVNESDEAEDAKPTDKEPPPWGFFTFSCCFTASVTAYWTPV